jgi:DNA repair photolyase
MSFEWSLNPYQGCAHGCHYCYARSYHELRDQDPHDAFQSQIKAKINVARVLRRQLRRPSWSRQQVAIGTATDPYQPAEGRYRLTRACLQALHDHHTPISLVTKGTMIWRDAQLLAAMNRRAGATVIFSLTSLDQKLWRQLEPGTSPPQKRLEVMAHLRRQGVHVGVLIAPVLPGITDSLENLSTIVGAAHNHGAQFLGSQLVYLKPGAKEHFNAFLRSNYPGLVAEYQRLFPGDYAPKRFSRRLSRRVDGLKKKHGLIGSAQSLQPQIIQLQLI